MKTQNTILPAISTDEEFENLKLNPEIFESAAREIIARHHLPDDALSLFEGTNVVFSCGKERVIKLFPPEHLNQFQSESLIMPHLYKQLSVSTPAIEFFGEISGWPYIVMSRVEGTLLEGFWETLDHHNKEIIIHELGALIREVHNLATDGLEAIDCHWEQFLSKQINHCVARHQETKLSDVLIQQIPHYLESIKDLLPKIKKPVILTGEYTPMNFLVKQKSGIWHINGLIDFGDCMLGLAEYDLLGPAVFLAQGDEKLLRAFLISYGYLPEQLTNSLSHQFTALLLLHRYSNLNIQIRIENWKDKVQSLEDLEKLVWGF